MNKNTLRTILKILVSVVLFYLIFRQVHPETVTKNILMINFSYLWVLLPLLALNYLVSSYRWKKLLIHENTEHVSLSYLTGLYFIGSFFNNFMPTSVGGDVYKVYALGKKIKHNANAFTATFMERFTGVLALVFISYIGLVKTLNIIVSLLPEFIKNSSLNVAIFKFFLFFGIWILLFLGIYLFKKISNKVEILKKLRNSFGMYKGKNNVFIGAVLTSFIVQFISIFTQFFVFKALGVDLPLWYALFTFPVIALLGFFIPSLNGFGVQDALYMQLFMYVGVSTEISLSASIVYHLLRLFVSLFGGILYASGKFD